MNVKYYCTQRPPAPGAVPAGGLIETEDYGERRYIPDIDRMAWGAVVYDRELAPWEIMRYELTREPREDE